MITSVCKFDTVSCARCAVYKTYTFSDAFSGSITLELHQCEHTFHAHIQGSGPSIFLFEVSCELKNGRNTEWLKECIDAFLKQILSEGFQLQRRPDHRSPALPATHALPRKADLTNSDISSFFHLPIKEASRELGLSTTYLKRICRQLGIPRWPYRKVASLDFDVR
uniref:Minus dominance protein n=1 Tax=Yamagishiella unicocca TaxID=51707 RepID=A0A218PH05_9CHLO|nr:minus dominance protein [Yamagishiella unicocca]BBC28454.1 minus dominance protein, RWP-RK containing transcription factor [Yamagishiella unicocca]